VEVLRLPGSSTEFALCAEHLAESVSNLATATSQVIEQRARAPRGNPLSREMDEAWSRLETLSGLDRQRWSRWRRRRQADAEIDTRLESPEISAAWEQVDRGLRDLTTQLVAGADRTDAHLDRLQNDHAAE
jgi:hypothetical protein